MAYANESAVPIRDDIYWIGGDDRTASIFEGAFPIPEGVSYNSYLIRDEKTCLLDSCDASIAAKFWRNLRTALDGRPLDYFVINHMEPDHGACITQVMETWPEVTVIGNAKTFEMMENFYHIQPKNRLEVKEGDEVAIGKHTLRFYFAVMVHWPEVMFTYDVGERILFSADAFGTFKTLSGALYADETDFDREYLDEARRYYSNIVGKYGSKVQAVFKKLDGVPIDMICPLHGPIWRKDLGYILGKYDLWSRYEPEEKGVVIAYSSMYGNTAAVADRLALLLKERGVANVTMYDVTRMHQHRPGRTDLQQRPAPDHVSRHRGHGEHGRPGEGVLLNRQRVLGPPVPQDHGGAHVQAQGHDQGRGDLRHQVLHEGRPAPRAREARRRDRRLDVLKQVPTGDAGFPLPFPYFPSLPVVNVRARCLIYKHKYKNTPV